MPMMGRLTIMQADPGKVEEGIRYVRDVVHPAIAEYPGCYGVGAWVNRETGLTVVISAWADEVSMRASEESISSLRQEAGRITGAQGARVEMIEPTFLKQNEPDQPGYWARTVEVQVPVERFEEALARFRETGSEQVLRLPGVTSVTQLVNRATGLGFVTTTFKTRAAMDASREQAERIRGQAMTAVGGHVVEVYETEVAYVGISGTSDVLAPRTVELPSETTV